MPGPTIRTPMYLKDDPRTIRLKRVLNNRTKFGAAANALIAEGIIVRLTVLAATQSVKGKLSMSVEELAAYLDSKVAAGSVIECGLVEENDGKLKLVGFPSRKAENVPPPPEAIGIADEIQNEWNDLAEKKDLPVALTITSRLPVIAQRLKDQGFVKGWKKALAVLGKSAWHCGKNDRGWKASIDWFLGTKGGTPNWQRLLENKDALLSGDTERVPHYLRGSNG